MDREKEIQKIIKSKYMKGPKFCMSEDATGINYFSGSKKSAYYELYGTSTIYRLIIIEPSENLFTSFYVGKGHLLLLILEKDQVQGGFVALSDSSLSKEVLTEFQKIFVHFSEEQIEELYDLWINFISDHYFSIF